MSQQLYEAGEVAPHSQQAEGAAIGSVLINPNAYFEVCGFLHSEDFFILRNQWIWEAMERLHKRGDRIEFLTVVEELKAQGRLDDAGGSAYLTDLAANTATSVHAETYGRVIERAAIRRAGMVANAESMNILLDPDADVHEIENAVRAEWDAAFSRNHTSRQRSLNAILSDALDRATVAEDGKPRGIPFFLEDLQLYFGEIPLGYFVVVAARQGTGKSRFVIQWALHAALSGKRVVFFSAEDDPEEIVWTMISMMSAAANRKSEFINFRTLQQGLLHEDHDAFGRYAKFSQQLLEECDLTIIDAREMTAMQVSTTMRQIGSADMAIVDYIGELQPMPAPQGQRFDKLAEYNERVRLLRNMAVSSGALTICVSQFNREGASGDPSTEHLAKSDELGNTAKVAFAITESKGVMTVKCIKDRHLGINHKSVKLYLHPNYGTYTELHSNEKDNGQISVQLDSIF